MFLMTAPASFIKFPERPQSNEDYDNENQRPKAGYQSYTIYRIILL